MSKWSVTILAIAVLASTGCVMSHMETPRQLERGETVIHRSLAYPGWYGMAPRGQMSVMRGLGGGDVTVHAGTAGVTTNTGLSGRIYLDDSWTMSLQNDLHLNWLDGGGGGTGMVPMPPPDISKFSVTPRLIRNSERRAYFGLQVPVAFLFFIRDDEDSVCCIPSPGLVFGVEGSGSDRSWRPQFEFVLAYPLPQIHLGQNR